MTRIARPSPRIFVGCPECKWVQARLDVVETCESGRHRARLMEVQYTCRTCRWTAWCKGPAQCSQSKSHELEARAARPVKQQRP